MLEKRGMYVCRICKHGPVQGRSHNPSGGSANSCSPIQNSSGGIKDEDIEWNENSLGESTSKDSIRGTSLDSKGNIQAMQGMGRESTAAASAIDQESQTLVSLLERGMG